MLEITPNETSLIPPPSLLEDLPTLAAILIDLTNKSGTKSTWFV